jgi:hypothetical protein
MGSKQYFLKIKKGQISKFLKTCCFARLQVLSRELYGNCALLDYYAASNGNFLPNVCPKTSLRNYHHKLRNSAEKRSPQLASLFILFIF